MLTWTRSQLTRSQLWYGNLNKKSIDKRAFFLLSYLYLFFFVDVNDVVVEIHNHHIVGRSTVKTDDQFKWVKMSSLSFTVKAPCSFNGFPSMVESLS